MTEQKNVREVLTGYYPIAYAHNSEVGVRQTDGEKIRIQDMALTTIFDPSNLVVHELEYPLDFMMLEDLLHRKTLPGNGAEMNKAQLLLGRHPLIERYDAVFTRDTVPELPEGIFVDGDKLVILHSAVTKVDGVKQPVILFAVNDPKHYEAIYGFVEIAETSENVYAASDTASICEIVNCYL